MDKEVPDIIWDSAEATTSRRDSAEYFRTLGLEAVQNTKEEVYMMDWILHKIDMSTISQKFDQSQDQESLRESPPRKMMKTLDPRLEVKGKVPSSSPVTPKNKESIIKKPEEGVFATKVVEKLKQLSQKELDNQFRTPESSPSAKKHECNVKVTIEGFNELLDTKHEQEAAESLRT